MRNPLALTACLAAAAALSLPAPLVYRDPAGRFSFSYPDTFGSPSKGTDDGFHDRVAAVRFDHFPARLGREAVLTRGFPLVDLQAAGGLYDSITLQILPDGLRQRVMAALPLLTAETFCAAVAAPQHLDVNLPAFAGLRRQQRDGIAATDAINNTGIEVVQCRRADQIVVFDKTRRASPAAPPQHVFGAVRFLTGPYSTFQFIAGGDAPDPALLATMSDVVRSFTTGAR
jgi:hypothetical protein